MVVRCVDDQLRATAARPPARQPDGCVLARECAHALVKSALANGSADNVTAMVILIDWTFSRTTVSGGAAMDGQAQVAMPPLDAQPPT
mmetsp:Transcript_19442/g.49427  ORF Transcript_19442/g.49427 Transcript_19442/m.49427 type:complete len:88 (-) Transcript_19442:135-398(-)